jgi:hypothetical protein
LVCVILRGPRNAALGAGLSLLVISSVNFTHLTSMGIQVLDPATSERDNSPLFGLANLVAVSSAVAMFFHRRQLRLVGHCYLPP